MSQQPLDFERSVADAADCYVAQEGSIDAAIDALVERRGEFEEGRVEEALAYLKHKRGTDL